MRSEAIPPSLDLDQHPEALAPKAVFRGTTIRILHVAELVAQGLSEADILSRHPELTARDVLFAPMFKVMMTPPKHLVN